MKIQRSPVSKVSLISVSLLIGAACGGDQGSESAAPGAALQPVPASSSVLAPQGASGSDQSLEDDHSNHSSALDCDLSLMLGLSQYVIAGGTVEFKGDGMVLSGEWTIIARGEEWSTLPLLDAVLPKDGTVLRSGLPGWSEFEGVSVSRKPVLFVGLALDRSGPPEATSIAVAATEPAFRFGGDCGTLWSDSITRSTSTPDVAEVAQMLMSARGKSPGEWNELLNNLYLLQSGAGGERLAWYSQDTSVRSLSPFDIPPAERTQYRYSVVNFVFDFKPAAGELWTVQLETSDGLAFNVAVSGAGGPVAVGYPSREAGGVLRLIGPGGLVVEALEVGTAWIDEALGATLVVSGADRGAATIDSYGAMAPGELERLLSLTRDEIELLRESIYRGDQVPSLSPPAPDANPPVAVND